MNYMLYDSILKKAQVALAEKTIPNAPADFDQIRIPALYVRVFRFAAKVKRKVMRRFQK